MQNNIQVLNEELKDRLSEGWDVIAKILYQYYDSDAEKISPQVGEYYRLIEQYTDGLPFGIQNQICSAATGLCSEYERIAFADGILLGAKLILELSGR